MFSINKEKLFCYLRRNFSVHLLLLLQGLRNLINSCRFMNSYKLLNSFLFLSFQVQIDNDKIRRDRETRGSRIDLSGLCVSSNATTQSISTMRQHTEQRTPSSRVRNGNGLIIDSQGNSIPLSPVSSNTSSGSDNMDQHKTVPMTPSGERRRKFHSRLDFFSLESSDFL